MLSKADAFPFAPQLMRRNLLRLVHVREFSTEAVFRDPCLSFTLPNVICTYCNDCRDLDLCRDPLLLRREWRCATPDCAHPYDRQWVENALLQIVRQRSRMFQLQDLKCRKCRQVRGNGRMVRRGSILTNGQQSRFT